MSNRVLRRQSNNNPGPNMQNRARPNNQNRGTNNQSQQNSTIYTPPKNFYINDYMKTIITQVKPKEPVPVLNLSWTTSTQTQKYI